MTEFMRPQVTVDQIDDRVARYVVEPLERGFGYTLGNSMRRVLLSSLQGAAATSIRIEGVQHEFTAIDGVDRDLGPHELCHQAASLASRSDYFE